MKRASSKRAARNKKPSPDLVRQYIQSLVEQHQHEWHEELMAAAPYWTHLLCLHLRIVELDHLEEAVQELSMTRAALYARVSSYDQNPESQLLDLRQLAKQRGWEISEVYVDHGVSGTRVRRPALDKLMADAARHRFDVVAVAGFDRMARSVRHLRETLDELHRLGIEFLSLRENIDSAAPLGRAIFIIVGAVAELERNLIIERVRAGMRRARSGRTAHWTTSSGTRSCCHHPRSPTGTQSYGDCQDPPRVPDDDQPCFTGVSQKGPKARLT